MPFLFAFAFLLALLGWPLIIDTGRYLFVITGGMWVLVGMLWFYNGSEIVSYLEGLTIVARASRMGCAGFGILLVLPVLVSVFVISLFFLLEGIIRGRQVSQNHWIKLISWFGYGIAQSRRTRSKI